MRPGAIPRKRKHRRCGLGGFAGAELQHRMSNQDHPFYNVGPYGWGRWKMVGMRSQWNVEGPWSFLGDKPQRNVEKTIGETLGQSFISAVFSIFYVDVQEGQ